MPVPPSLHWNVRRSAFAATEFDRHEFVPLAEIRPTQVELLTLSARKSSDMLKALGGCADFWRSGPYLLCLGPGEDYYIIDHHHLSLALWQSKVDEVCVRVVGDLSNMPKPDFFACHGRPRFGFTPLTPVGGRSEPNAVARVARSAAVRTAIATWPGRCERPGASRRQAVPFSEFAWANFLPQARARQPWCRAISNLRTNERCASRARSMRDYLPGNVYGSRL